MVGIPLAHQKSNLMETTALTLTSLPTETAPGNPAQIQAQPSGEFAKILQSQPAQAENPGEKTSEDREGDQLPAADKEITNQWFSVPSPLLPEGQSPSGEKGLGAVSSGSENLGNDGAAQIFAVPIPEAMIKDGSAAGVQKDALPENPSSPLEKSFNLGLSPNESSLPTRSTRELLTPGKETANFLPAETARINGPDPRLWHNPESGGESGGDLKDPVKTEQANFASGFSIKGKDLFPSDLPTVEISKPGSSKAEGLLGNPAAPAEHSAAPRPVGEIRLEGTSGSNQPQKEEVYEQISQKMVWSLKQQEEKVRLILDPPHLGSIYMEIQRDKDQVKATLWAENPHTKQILESNQLSIQKIIETEGFSLESFNVFVEQNLGSFQESRERMGSPESEISNPTAEADRALGPGPTAPSPFIRESSGRLRSIDLII